MDRRAFLRGVSGLIAAHPFAGTPSLDSLAAWLGREREPFQRPDILANAGFETGWDGFTNFSRGDPVGVSRATDFARSGDFSARFQWSPHSADHGAQFAYAFAPRDRLHVRFHFRLTSQVSTIWKLCRHRQRGFGALMGGLFVERGPRILSWGFDTEVRAQTTGLGLTPGDVLDGKWHSIEFDYWRNGDPTGYPSVAFWLDGQSVSGSRAPGPATWHDGRLVAGERSTHVRIGLLQMLGTLNGGNRTAGQCNIDDVAISSVGRIGP